jgi:hypothetical protein
VSPPVRRSRALPLETATRRAMMARDAGLRRIRAVTRWVAAGVVVLSGALALIAARAFHGRTISNTPSSSSSSPGTSSGSAAQTQPPASSGVPIQQPAQAPAPTQAPPVVASGGS